MKEIGGNKSAMEVDSYLKTLVLENHELLTFTGQMVSLPAPKATEAKILEAYGRGGFLDPNLPRWLEIRKVLMIFICFPNIIVLVYLRRTR